jgi:hypothetical protein
MRNSWIVLIVLAAALVGSLSAQVFPVRFADSSEPTPNAPTSVDAVRLDAVWFNALDAKPFACDASAVGVVYLQKDLTGAIGGRDHLLCLCAKEDTATYLWRNLSGSQDCATAEL